ncbi:DUF4291 domain-containing protein [Paractinoplanes ferrugineus]|uniref:DUF4291 domain-containing protein n=1 Tax=Paractinoplanes ferrugineus TaxID=113564 RepID=A0A919IZI8_9ACTN|nr:DUF4291 domain-containing protein [Actinoplanes ferrugineus]GIE10672.1 hypothetical protein Afe05nite_25120 [Actinoplanes ferrugineus]
MHTPLRQVRASYTDHTITVYQAYSPAIARPALAAGRFVAPFRRERMTWIKPSFRWMMYRCGWATKPGQEHVLAVEIRRDGFEWALANAALSHFDRDRYPDRDTWSRAVRTSPVRVQWDPERSLRLAPLPHRSVQVGLSADAVARYVDEWTVRLTDVTGLARTIHTHVAAGNLAAATDLLPAERPYPLPPALADRLGATA